MKLTSAILSVRRPFSEGESVDGAKEGCALSNSLSGRVVIGIVVICVGIRGSWICFRLSWRYVNRRPCCLSDRGCRVRVTISAVKALFPWSGCRVIGFVLPIPQESENFLCLAFIGRAIKLDVISWGITSLKVSEPMHVDSTLHSVFQRGGGGGSRALNETKLCVATAVRERLVGGHLPVVVSGLLDALREGARAVSDLVGHHDVRSCGFDFGPGEVISGASVFPVGDAGELVSLALLGEDIGIEVCTSRNGHGDVNLLAVPGLDTGIRILRDLNADSVLEVSASIAADGSDRVSVIFVGVLASHLGDVGEKVEFHIATVGAGVVVDHASHQSIFLVESSQTANSEKTKQKHRPFSK